MVDAKCSAAARGWSCSRRAGHRGPCAAVQRATPLHQKLAGFVEDLQGLAQDAERIRDQRHFENLEEDGDMISRGIRAAFRETI